MSSTLVLVKKIDRIDKHPNAERLELAIVGGWQCVVPIGKYVAGSLITYIPPDSVLPETLSDSLGVTKYLSKGRVRAAKMRGEPSFGLVIDAHGGEGENVADKLGITKYVPPLKFNAGEVEAPDDRFQQYTDIENLRNYPEVLSVGERVIATEKIHGTNARVGMVRGEDGAWKKVAGSRTLQRRDAEGSLYWFPWRIPAVDAMLAAFGEADSRMQVVLFGEVYGKVQSLRYGLPNGLGFRAFDLMLNGQYQDHDALSIACKTYGAEMVPVVYDGPYSLEAIAAASKGRSLIAGAEHIREGVVVRPEHERRNEKTGRVILKYVSDEYLCGDFDGANE